MEEGKSVLLLKSGLFCERLQKFKLFWFFVSALCVREKPKVLKGEVGLRLAANGLNMVRAASYSISVYGLSIFKFTKSFSMKMKLRHALYFLLAAGRFFLCGRAGKLIDKFRLVRQAFTSDLAMYLTAKLGLFLSIMSGQILQFYSKLFKSKI